MARKRLTKWLRAVRAGGLDGKPIVYKPDWISRALSRAGILPPEEADAAIRGGRVSLGGRVVLEPLMLVRPDDEVALDGKKLDLAWPTMVIAWHKPADCLVASHDEHHDRPTVFDLFRASLPDDLKRYGWHAVGRLDVDTTGLLLFTNDERVVRHVTLPETHLPKRYLAKVGGTPDDAKLEPLRHGVELEDGVTRPAEARIRGPQEVELTITEGRRHQVKRMLKAVGLPVHKLHREAIGGVSLDVAESQWRMLTTEEVVEGLKLSLPAAPKPKE
jgi:23S rRNA pseudouridine2605 synthase/16S rRNA pseudouridine516 synthase